MILDMIFDEINGNKLIYFSNFVLRFQKKSERFYLNELICLQHIRIKKP